MFTALPEDTPVRRLVAGARPIEGRFGTVGDVAEGAEYFAGPLSRWLSGQHALISGGAQQ